MGQRQGRGSWIYVDAVSCDKLQVGVFSAKGVESAIPGISQTGNDVLFLIQVTVDGAGMQLDIGEFCGESRDAFRGGNEADDGNSLGSPTLEPMDDRS